MGCHCELGGLHELLALLTQSPLKPSELQSGPSYFWPLAYLSHVVWWTEAGLGILNLDT